jgi:hypothetical protein
LANLCAIRGLSVASKECQDLPDQSGDTRGSDAFFDWPATEAVTFRVCRLLTPLQDDRPKRQCRDEQILSRIIAVVPGISPKDLLVQLDGADAIGRDESSQAMWHELCALAPPTKHPGLKIRACTDPTGRNLTQPNAARAAASAMLPCTALSHAIETIGEYCAVGGGSASNAFPQDDFVGETLHTTYTAYAAYFDLARQQVRNILCRYADDPAIIPKKCRLP